MFKTLNYNPQHDNDPLLLSTTALLSTFQTTSVAARFGSMISVQATTERNINISRKLQVVTVTSMLNSAIVCSRLPSALTLQRHTNRKRAPQVHELTSL